MEALEGLPGTMVIADDILVFGKGETIEEATLDHDKNVQELMKRLEAKNIRLNKEKIQYKTRSVTYMGHVLCEDGVKIDESKVKAIVQIQRP